MNELEYLLVPGRYARFLGGLDWSPTCDAIVDVDGNAVVLTPALAQLIEGAGARDRLVHFGFVLHFVHHLTRSDDRLHKAWSATAGSMRNAGALFAELARALPRAPDSVDTRGLCALLRRQSELGGVHFISHPAVTPPLTPEGFDAHLAHALAGLTDADLAHWLRHGRGAPVNRHAPLLELPPAPPRTLGGELEQALKRKRLAGVAPFVDQMISALTLPPRRVMRSELPVGGYSSVTNRGHPDQILPGEFAVDELEFLRRYAANELLYWRREEPQSRVREDLIILCDQGVRTWGEPRLALTAAAVALGRKAAQRGKAVRYAATANSGEPVTDDITGLLEGSDLTPTPGLALERVLEEPAFDYRDVVLLTHPRNLTEPDVRAAACRVAPGVRLFAFTVDENGGAELSEIRQGRAVSLRAFQLTHPDVELTPVAEAAPDAAWTGMVETIGYPFRFGIVGAIHHMAMDTRGRRLFTASEGGLLHAWAPEDGRGEILPRPMRGDRLLGDPLAIVGVRGGFAGCYRDGAGLVVAHYDLVSRKATNFPVSPGVAIYSEPLAFSYIDRHHCVYINMPDGKGAQVAHAVDLDTGEVSPPGGRSRRVDDALKTGMESGGHPLPPALEIVHQPPERMRKPTAFGPRGVLAHTAKDGRIGLLTEAEVWKAWTPRSDGGPLLKDARIIEAVHAGGTLLLRAHKDNHEHVLIYRGPDWRFFGEYNAQLGAHGLAVSGDGARVAFRNKGAGAVCFQIGDTAERLFTAGAARSHSLVEVETGDNWFTVYGGKFTHLVRWDRERLEVAFLQGRHTIEDFIQRKREAVSLSPRKVHLRPGQVSPCKYDPARFQRYAYSPGGLLFVSDKHGEIAVFDAAETLVAMFFVFRGTVAACLPDGTRYGPSSITGGPTSPDALGKIGHALKHAAAGRRR